MSEVNVHPAAPGDWARVRAVRLRALADTPDAFGTTWAEDEAQPPAFWQSRLASDQAATFLGVRAGADVGMAVGAPYGEVGGLFGMWVAPEARGTGLGEALIRAVIEWATAKGYTRLRLGVGDFNTPAINLYRRMGFTRTGEVDCLPPPREHILEHIRERPLGGRGPA